MRKSLLSLILVLLTISATWAQGRKVTGKVVSQEEPNGLPGVNVLVKGTTVGAITDLDGMYSITVPEGQNTLVFSFIGYSSFESKIGNQSTVNVTLSPDTQNLDEVIVVAYGSAEKGNFAGSAIAIKEASIANRPINSVTNVLEGQAAGVITTSASGQPGESPTIRIRGIGSVNASQNPLYVVDGVPYDGDISNLNPKDIADVTVLKDASSSALYGARAANGVIMITTKKGGKNKPTFNISIRQGVSSRALPEYDRVNADEYYPLTWESLKFGQMTNSNMAENAASQYASENLIPVLKYNVYDVPNNEVVGVDGMLNSGAVNNFTDLDWFDAVTRSGGRGEYNMSYSGGTDRTDYYTSIGYLNEKGFVIKSDMERFTGRINVNTQATDWFKTGINLSATMTEGNNAATSGNSSYVNPFFFARNMGPIYPVYLQNQQTGGYILDANGQKIYDTGDMTNLGSVFRGSGGSPGRHVVQETKLNENFYDRDVISARAYAEIDFLKNFKFRSNISTDMISYLGVGYDNPIVGDGAPSGRTDRLNTRRNSMTFNQILSYANTINIKHYFEGLVAHENYDLKINRQEIAKQGQILDGNIEPGNFVTVNSADGRVDSYRIESYFSRFNYVYDDKYSLSASIRRDGSSRFFEDVRWGTFWSVAGAWNIEKEAFFNADFFDMLKLRASYGEVGNDGLLDDAGSPDYYPWQALYDLDYNNANEPGILQGSLSATELLWESNNTFDIGIDFAFAKRFTGTLEYYYRVSENLLFDVPLSLTTGIESTPVNVGTMSNTGIELQLQGDIIRNQDFTWNANLNVSTFKNEFKKLPFEEQVVGTKKLVVGGSIYDYWLRDWRGVDPETGYGMYTAVEKLTTEGSLRDDVIIQGQDTLTTTLSNAAYHSAGTAIPDFTGGLSNTFTYKNISLSILTSFSVGGDIYDGVYASMMTSSPDGSSLHKDILNRWETAGDITNVPRMDNIQGQQSNGGSDRWLIDRSYLNLRSINLSYILPANLLKKVDASQASIYVAGENLGWLSKRKGMFVSESFNGTTSNTYTPAKTFTLGLNVSF
ncbi:SusC/RagA family TonB-linked outer membrane protein [Echinicola pacifica]|uniref:SusC/RagA family TonB-linked outer membrane protein n=1 Tax=Echinicola pacifica TaxID=346377 RepID=A0A918PT58_9BACT|nr:SusC/RagA family TonB-linked outer membrane protein [Echinicola pacifica]GGZ21125.1 SusC/RagA family TonB-linked outer membrane protein [Echinicola pacifica]